MAVEDKLNSTNVYSNPNLVSSGGDVTGTSNHINLQEEDTFKIEDNENPADNSEEISVIQAKRYDLNKQMEEL